jgi:hypothetical protein
MNGARTLNQAQLSPLAATLLGFLCGVSGCTVFAVLFQRVDGPALSKPPRAHFISPPSAVCLPEISPETAHGIPNHARPSDDYESPGGIWL